MKPAAVVLVHYGRPEVTRACLASLAQHETVPHTVVVVDHGPAPGLQGQLDGAHPDLRILADLDNPGFAAGCNRGAAEAFDQGADAVWFLNNDARLAGPLLGVLQAQARRHPEVVLWGTHQLHGQRRLGCDRQPPWFARGASVAVEGLQGGRALAPRESLSGASVFLTRAAWDRLGPWPDTYFLYYEDAAWCQRAHQQGLPMVLLDEAVLHDPGTTTGRHSALTLFYGTRNQLRLRFGGAGGSAPGILLAAAYLLQRRLFRGQFRALRPVLDGCLAAARGEQGRSRKY